MKIAEKLDELRNNILRDKSDLIAGDTDSLWDDESLLRYIKQGERRFARQTLCIRDGTTPQVTQITLKTGVMTYALHASVLGVLSARYDTDDFDLLRSGHGVLNQAAPPEFLSFDPASVSSLSPGRPTAYYTDETLVFARAGIVTLSVSPAPAADQNGKKLYLRVVRTPLTTYDISKIDDEQSEIPEDYELDPLQWAAHLATANHDADAGSPIKSIKHKEAFEGRVAECVKETKRKIFGHMGHRFGMNGFSWER